MNRIDKGASCISQVELNLSLFSINLPFGNAARLKEPGSLEALKFSFLPAFGETPHLPSRRALIGPDDGELFKSGVSATDSRKNKQWEVS